MTMEEKGIHPEPENEGELYNCAGEPDLNFRAGSHGEIAFMSSNKGMRLVAKGYRLGAVSGSGRRRLER